MAHEIKKLHVQQGFTSKTIGVIFLIVVANGYVLVTKVHRPKTHDFCFVLIPFWHLKSRIELSSFKFLVNKLSKAQFPHAQVSCQVLSFVKSVTQV